MGSPLLSPLRARMVAKDDLLCPCLPGRERVPATRKRVEPERVTVLAGAPYGPLRSRERRCFVVDRDHARTIRYDASERSHHGASSGLRILRERPLTTAAYPSAARSEAGKAMLIQWDLRRAAAQEVRSAAVRFVLSLGINSRNREHNG